MDDVHKLRLSGDESNDQPVETEDAQLPEFLAGDEHGSAVVDDVTAHAIAAE